MIVLADGAKILKNHRVAASPVGGRNNVFIKLRGGVLVLEGKTKLFDHGVGQDISRHALDFRLRLRCG